ncbi:MAG: flagellar motor protein MotA [Bacteroidetes bacterium MED-G17]|nr:MAG: flagellar motor protein MotA [Bacteroidetes bacterium TMED39]PDH53232.1 MAG: flagellar motor protein MotA [Bacteroidetes bacterium MED-G17]CAI8263932.1 MAG: Uncharacterised protein [Bacteroidetes bacterium MED-G17]|tara:strand:+ start:3568 stop:4410 length:843 start_codon:yes stop_codon:yes gene_type:complete
MKKQILIFAILSGLFLFGSTSVLIAEEIENDTAETEQIDSSTVETADSGVTNENPEEANEKAPVVKKQGRKVIKEKFIEGGAGFMALPLIALILGLAIAIERMLTLWLGSINTVKFVESIDEATADGNVEKALEISRNTKGPVASIFYQGLDRAKEGIDMVEKSVVSYGSVQTGKLEKGLVWISLCIALAPMLGFLGTVIGMIQAFDEIERVGDISPSVVAGGIKVALLTTVAGLIVAIILQIFYNLILSKVDSVVNEMEETSVSLVDILLKNNVVNTEK